MWTRDVKEENIGDKHNAVKRWGVNTHIFGKSSESEGKHSHESSQFEHKKRRKSHIGINISTTG